MTVSLSCCFMSGILCTTDMTDGAALKSVSKLVLTLSHTLESNPRDANESYQSIRSPRNAFLTCVIVCSSVHPAPVLWLRTF